jgi:hypothetical protein
MISWIDLTSIDHDGMGLVRSRRIGNTSAMAFAGDEVLPGHGRSPPRSCKRHELLDVLILRLCEVLCGAQSWVDMADYAQTKKDWLQTFLDLSNGISSHDTFDRIFRLPDPQQHLSASLKTSFHRRASLREIPFTERSDIAKSYAGLRRGYSRSSGELFARLRLGLGSSCRGSAVLLAPFGLERTRCKGKNQKRLDFPSRAW